VKYDDGDEAKGLSAKASEHGCRFYGIYTSAAELVLELILFFVSLDRLDDVDCRGDRG
jgi:hypothetical protein